QTCLCRRDSYALGLPRFVSSSRVGRLEELLRGRVVQLGRAPSPPPPRESAPRSRRAPPPPPPPKNPPPPPPPP
ncbi:hypothetical protein AUM95_22625, partial [Cronobacter sakazakii]